MVQIGIMPAVGQQAVMSPFLKNTAVFPDDNAVRVPDHREGVGEDGGQGQAFTLIINSKLWHLHKAIAY